MGERITVTVEVDTYTLTGSVFVKDDGEADSDDVRVSEHDVPNEEISWLAKNQAEVEGAIRDAAEGTFATMKEEEADRGFDIYDDEDAFGSEEFGETILDDLWG